MRKYVLYLALLAGLLTGCYNEEDSREHVLKVYRDSRKLVQTNLTI